MYNFENPVRRDVVNTGVAGDNTTIRFVTDNSGAWILHWFVFFYLYSFLLYPIKLGSEIYLGTNFYFYLLQIATLTST